MFEIRLGTDDDKELLKHLYPRTIPVLGDGGYLILAVTKDEIVGFLWAFMRNIPAPIDRKEMFINVIEVTTEEFRCQGLATEMLEKIKTIATKEKAYQIRAYCDISNVSSHYLWVKNGYSVNPITMSDGTIVGSYVSLVI